MSKVEGSYPSVEVSHFTGWGRVVTGPGGTGKTFLIHTVVGYLTLCQGKFVEVLASSGSAAYLLGGKTVHRFFHLGVNLECFLEWGTIASSMVSNADVLIIDECSMMSASLLEKVHNLCCFATKDPEKTKLLFAGKSIYLEICFNFLLLTIPSCSKALYGNISKWYHSKKTADSLKI